MEEERELVDLRVLGCERPEIAAKRGGTPQPLRKQFGRAVERVEEPRRELDR